MTPLSLKGATTISTGQAQKLVAAGTVSVDVFGPRDHNYDPLDGTWRDLPAHPTLPGAIWLPNIGQGTLDSALTGYFHDEMNRLIGPPPGRSVMFFCRANCWMSWNVARRAVLAGYTHVFWYRQGTDGWQKAGLKLTPAPLPPPVKLE